MNSKFTPMTQPTIHTLLMACVLSFTACSQSLCYSQQETESGKDVSRDAIGSGDREAIPTIIVQTNQEPPKLPVIFSGQSTARITVGEDSIEQQILLQGKVLQGEAQTVSFGIEGASEVIAVTEPKEDDGSLLSWAVRKEGEKRFLDLHLKEFPETFEVSVKTKSASYELPTVADVTHLTPGTAVAFDSQLYVRYNAGIQGKLLSAKGFRPLSLEMAILDSVSAASNSMPFQTNSGGKLQLMLDRDASAPLPVELSDTTLYGEIHPSGQSINFQLRGNAIVNQVDASIDVLSGQAAVSRVSNDAGYRLRLVTKNSAPVYQLAFDEPGEYAIELDFVAKVDSNSVNEHQVDFTVAASAIVPLTLDGLDAESKFERSSESVVLVRGDQSWTGFLPADGRANLTWKTARQSAGGKLFFSTGSQIEATVGTGLLRQTHDISYQILQGEMKSVDLHVVGEGQIMDVRAENLVSWEVTSEDNARVLKIQFSQPISEYAKIQIRSQNQLSDFPVRVAGLRLEPIGAIRQSGFLRLSNDGLVRLEPTELSGLTQLSASQFPGEPIDSRQVFVYRFPAADYSFTVSADRVQPEVSVSELVVYELAETDRTIHADIEMDIRDAPIREWDFVVPADYSVVAVTGASVADYVTAADETDGRRELKIIFGEDVLGRQLVSLHLEQSTPAVQSDWNLPRLEFPGTKSVRGDIGVVAAPGYRIAVGATSQITEKPLSYFPKPSSNLQQAFRLRGPEWTATMQIEPLDRIVQADLLHLYSLSEETVFGSALINYFITGAPVSEWKIQVPETLGNVMVDGENIRTWRREGETLIVSLHQPAMGSYTLLVTFEEKPEPEQKSESRTAKFQVGQVTPLDVQGDRGYVQVVSHKQVELSVLSESNDLLKLDPLELPAEFRLLSTAPPLGTWEYTQRPFDLELQVKWFQPASTVTQIVEFAEANSRVSADGELVTDVVYFVKTRGKPTLRIKLPDDPVRLWEVSVAGQAVTARQTDDATLIPLPGGTDPNVPIEVSLRLGKPSTSEFSATLMLPIVYAPVLKTQWNVVGDEQRALIPSGGNVTPPIPVQRPTGFDWIAQRGLIPFTILIFMLSLGIWGCLGSGVRLLGGLVCLLLAMGGSAVLATEAATQIQPLAPLAMNLPILTSGELVELQVSNRPHWSVNISWLGLAAIGLGVLFTVVAYFVRSGKPVFRCIAMGMIAAGILMQGDGATWFFALLAVGCLIGIFIPGVWRFSKTQEWLKQQNQSADDKPDELVSSDAFTPIAPTALLLAILLSPTSSALAKSPTGFQTADTIAQTWKVIRKDARLTATGTLQVSGKPGDRFVLLKSPAVLTQFAGEGLRLTKREIPGYGLNYIVSIPASESNSGDDAAPDDDTETSDSNQPSREADFEATFEFQFEALKPIEGIPVLTGEAAIQTVDFQFDEPGWIVISKAAQRIEAIAIDNATRAKLLISPGDAVISLKPKTRDVSREITKFFAEAANLYSPAPGVVDGRHRFRIRPSQGQVSEVAIAVPDGLTISSVSGPVGSWQFDADKGHLAIQIEPSQSAPFEVNIESQRGLEPLPTEVTLAPLRIKDAIGEVGMMAMAFDSEAQPAKLVPNGMSMVNLGDFDQTLLTNKQTTLHRVFRYGKQEASLQASVTPVSPEVRVLTKQVVSLGDERVVLGIGLLAEITRAGLFQLSFTLPDGMEVESLSGEALDHWSELNDNDQRRIVMHLQEKTIGPQSFSITLTGPAPVDVLEWQLPEFRINEATRQTGEVVIKPTTGIRLRTISRKNVSESDPRNLGGTSKGAIAFRILQDDWNLVLGIETLAPWVTGQVLQEVTLREGQTRNALMAEFDVKNAPIGALKVVLPITDIDEIKTIRATGDAVSDLVRTANDSNIWELTFKRRMIGKLNFRIEFERRGDRVGDLESIVPAKFPDTRQLASYFAIRSGGRLELDLPEQSQGWQLADWTMVPAKLREAENQSPPAITVRAVAPTKPLAVRATRHSLADALKLRAAKGTLTTILSPTGDQLTAVEMTIDVIQRSNLKVGLPSGGKLMSVFVNDESANSIRLGDSESVWQFTVLPGIDDRTAEVRFVYSVPGDRFENIELASPQLNVPLENIQWNVVAPKGFELTDSDGNLELVYLGTKQTYDRKSYLSIVSGKRQVQATQAAELLDQANELLQAGDQTKARRALSSVANRYALDAASNEDARVQLENLQTQQAIVGLNTRRQRLFLNNASSDSAISIDRQYRDAAADNPILQDQINFRPQQLSQLLRGNTMEDNANLEQIACRIVEHQRMMEPASQAILISLPEEGSVYTFSRSVQVAEDVPLILELEFANEYDTTVWRTAALIGLLAAMVIGLTIATSASSKEVVDEV